MLEIVSDETVTEALVTRCRMTRMLRIYQRGEESYRIFLM